jgi:hypothetical protein
MLFVCQRIFSNRSVDLKVGVAVEILVGDTGYSTPDFLVRTGRMSPSCCLSTSRSGCRTARRPPFGRRT